MLLAFVRHPPKKRLKKVHDVQNLFSCSVYVILTDFGVLVLSVTLGEERTSKLDVCILGDDVSEKKPSPLIYNTAKERIGIDTDRCVVIEDSMVGLRAAKAAVSDFVYRPPNVIGHDLSNSYIF